MGLWDTCHELFKKVKLLILSYTHFFTGVGPRVRWVVGVGVGDIAFRDIFYFIVDFIVDFIQCMKFILYYCFLTKSTEIKDIHTYIHTYIQANGTTACPRVLP